MHEVKTEQSASLTTKATESTKSLFWLVEDDRVDAMVIRKALSSLAPDSIIHWEQDSPEALTKLETLPAEELPNIVFLDLRMPRMNGFEFLEKIKQNPGTSSINIIVVSTSSEDSDISLAKSLGASRYIIKTLDFGEFVEQLGNIEGIR